MGARGRFQVHIPCFTHFQKDRGPSPLLIFLKLETEEYCSRVSDKQTTELSFVQSYHPNTTEKRINLTSREDDSISTMNTVMRVPTTQATVSVQPQVPRSLAGQTFFEGPSFQGRPGGPLPRERPHAVWLEDPQRLQAGKPQDPQQSAHRQLPVGTSEKVPTNGALMGTPPATFDGDRSRADQFITQFGLFRIVNGGNAVITNPKRRVALALTYIRGPKVDAWVSQQYDALLSTKANHHPLASRTPRTGSTAGDNLKDDDPADDPEALWESFMAEFERAFAEPSWEVFARLENLRMAGDDVEMYIATFENMMRRAECRRESGPMVHYFRQGLPTNLERSITKRQAIPNTIDEWQSAARKEVERRALMKLYHLAGSEGGGDTGTGTGTGTGDAAAHIGVIRLSRLSDEERRLMREGRCFECSEKGHMAGDCPDKLSGRRTPDVE